MELSNNWRFWDKVAKEGECWKWKGAYTKTNGYGMFNFGGRNTTALQNMRKKLQ